MVPDLVEILKTTKKGEKKREREKYLFIKDNPTHPNWFQICEVNDL